MNPELLILLAKTEKLELDVSFIVWAVFYSWLFLSGFLLFQILFLHNFSIQLLLSKREKLLLKPT